MFLGEFVAQFKYTVLLTANGPITVTGISLENSLNLFKSEYKIEDPEVKVCAINLQNTYKHTYLGLNLFVYSNY